MALVALAQAQALSGARDVYGNYYDATTGQISSSLTGRVYNTARLAYTAPAWSPYVAAPVAYTSQVAYTAPLTYGSPYAGAYLLKK